MINTIYAEHSVSVTELKRNYASIVEEAKSPIAVFNHNRPEMYLVPAKYFEQMMNACRKGKNVMILINC